MLGHALSESRNGSVRGRVLGASRLQRAAWAFTTRRVHGVVCNLVEYAGPPAAGDLVLARVDAIGYHAALQLPNGRRKHLFEGDEIVVTYGNRYAPSQFEAVVPQTMGPCQLVASGGVAAKVLSWHSRITKGPTGITPLGLVVGPTGEIVNLREHALPAADGIPTPCPQTIAVVGTAMDSGKTQTAAFLVRGLTLAGLQVGYAKVTGTGAGGDTWLLKDAGASPVLDFTDAGLVSTYLSSPAEIQRVFATLMTCMVNSKVDAIVLEIADGVLQTETAALLSSPLFKRFVGGVFFAASDAMGAVAGHEWLTRRDLPVIAFSGVLTASPLQRAETSTATGLPVFTRQDLLEAKTAIGILSLAEQHRPVVRWNGALPGPATEYRGFELYSLASEASEENLAIPLEARS